MKTLINFLIIFLFIISPFKKGFSTIIEYIEFEKLIEDSSLIIHGKIETLTPYWDKELKRIFTKVKLNVLTTLKGENKKVIYFEILGGELDKIGQIVMGSPRLFKGEEILVFLRSEKNVHYINGFSLGLWKIKLDDKTKNKIAERQLQGLKLKYPKKLEIEIEKYNKVLFEELKKEIIMKEKENVFK